MNQIGQTLLLIGLIKLGLGLGQALEAALRRRWGD